MYKILAKTFFIGKKVIFLPSCHSTNLVAEEILKNEDIFDGTVVVTDKQTAGQGQRGNSWESTPGTNITLSILLKPGFINIQQQFFLNIAVSLGIADFLNAEGVGGVKVKWPNDIYCDDKKICGILIKNSLRQNRIASSIVGIGLNVNQTQFNIANATSLINELGKKLDLKYVFEQVLHFVEVRYIQLRNGNFSALHDSYINTMYWMGERRLFQSETSFYGTIENIDSFGRLQIRTKTALETFSFKEVRFIK